MVADGMEGVKIKTLGPKSGGEGVAAVAGATASASRLIERQSLMIALFGFAECLVFVSFLKDEEGLFLLPLI